jgi:flagellar basal-body rod protein FlgF
MTSSVYVALSAQMALQRRMETVANNVANLNTAGFRAEEVRFETVLSKMGPREVSYADSGDSYISRRSGSVAPTGNPLDVAVTGDAWFGVETPDGVAYTRDGRMQMTEAGDLVSVDGKPILDAGGAPIALDPRGGPVHIGADGSIVQGTIQVAALGLFTLPDTTRLERYGATAVTSSEPGQPVEDLAAQGVRQGFLEGANVDPIMEMTKLITISRTFDSAAAAIREGEDALTQAVRTLGPSQ